MSTYLQHSKNIGKLAAPMLLSRILGITISISGILMIARLGRYELAASALASSFFYAVIVSTYGTLYATAIIIGKAYGAGEEALIGQIVRHALLLSVLISIPCILLLWNIAPVFKLLGQKPELIPYIQALLRNYALYFLPTIIYVVFSQYVCGVSKPRIITYISMINAPIVVTLLYGLIFGRLGMPKLGIWGFGTAYVIGNSISVLLMFTYVTVSDHFKPYQLLKRSKALTRPARHILGIIKLGLPMGVQYGAELAVFSVTTILLGIFGTNALIAQQVSSQITVIVIMIPFTTAEAVSILIGQAIGRKDTGEIMQIGYTGCVITLIAYTIIAGFFIFFRETLAGFYIHSQHGSTEALMHLTLMFLIITLITQWFDSVRNVLTGGCRGMFDSKFPMLISIGSLWLIGLPLSYTLAFPLNWGPVGMRYGFLCSVVVGMLAVWLRFHYDATQLKKIPPLTTSDRNH